ncbi:MAG: HD domain-containing protein [Thermoproteota archaeon]|jgi:guanosine-3',5'-bis(diphosphate) 3'-pyrophosphohydrolase|nr:HD domain-containing protein [Thermoproteota archaeon]
MTGSINDFTKSGFSRLLKPFENSIDDILKITRAFSIAMQAHSGQFKKGNKVEPYINHPLRVALILTDELHEYNVDLICAAILHDSLCVNIKIGESQDRAIERIASLRARLKDEFGARVYDIVNTLAKPTLKSDEKERILGEYFGNIASGSQDVRYIKLVDRLDNIRGLKNAMQKDKVQRYKEETQKYVVPIAEKTDEKLVFKLSIALYELK